MGKLLKYIRGWAIVFAVLAPLMMLLEVSMDLIQPTLLADIIDNGVASGNINYILSVGFKMIIIAIFGLIGGVGCSVFSTLAAMKMGESLRESLFSKIQNLSFLEIDKFKTSSLITRVTNDVTQVQQMVMMGLRIMVRAPLICIGGMIMASILSPKLSIVFLIIIPIILVIVVLVLIKSFPMFKVMQEKIDNVNMVMRENLLGIRVIKAFTMEEKQNSRFEDANNELMNRSIKAQNVTMSLMPIVSLIMNLSVVAVLWYGGYLASGGIINAGKIMAFINYLIQILSSLMMMVMIVVNFSRAKASADRINEVLNEESSIKEINKTESLDGYSIEFKNVFFKYYENSEYVLEDISFKVDQGERVGIIGATGSGKSSLISLIPRFYDATSGDITIGGKNVRNLNIKELRENIGVVLQENILFQGTIEDNLKFGNREASKDVIEKAVKDAQAIEFISKKDKGYESEVEQRGKNLSGGQKQRLSIARTLIRKPKVLILDDSSSALDMATEGKLSKSIKSEMKGTTLFIIAQRISSVMDLDKIIVLDDGRISGVGTHNELLKNNDIYRSIAVSQLGEEVTLDGK